MKPVETHPDAKMHKSKTSDEAATEHLDEQIRAQVAMQQSGPVIDGNAMMNVPMYLY